MNSTTPNSDGASRPEGPRSPLRVMQALEELAGSRDGLTLTRLSEKLQTPKTSLLNLLRSLEAGSYVTQVNGHYQLGANALRLGALIGTRLTPESSLSSTLHPLLAEMMEQGGETTLLGVMGDDRRHGVYVDIIESRGAIRFSSLIGTRRPLRLPAIPRRPPLLAAARWGQASRRRANPTGRPSRRRRRNRVCRRTCWRR